jgi:hypothetical protein
MLTNHQDIQGIIDGCLWINQLAEKTIKFEEEEKVILVKEAWALICSFTNQSFANETNDLDTDEVVLRPFSDENTYEKLSIKLSITDKYEDSFETLRTYLLSDFLESRHKEKNQYGLNEDSDRFNVPITFEENFISDSRKTIGFYQRIHECVTSQKKLIKSFLANHIKLMGLIREVSIDDVLSEIYVRSLTNSRNEGVKNYLAFVKFNAYSYLLSQFNQKYLGIHRVSNQFKCYIDSITIYNFVLTGIKSDLNIFPKSLFSEIFTEGNSDIYIEKMKDYLSYSLKDYADDSESAYKSFTQVAQILEEAIDSGTLSVMISRADELVFKSLNKISLHNSLEYRDLENNRGENITPTRTLSPQAINHTFVSNLGNNWVYRASYTSPDSSDDFLSLSTIYSVPKQFTINMSSQPSKKLNDPETSSLRILSKSNKSCILFTNKMQKSRLKLFQFTSTFYLKIAVGLLVVLSGSIFYKNFPSEVAKFRTSRATVSSISNEFREEPKINDNKNMKLQRSLSEILLYTKEPVPLHGSLKEAIYQTLFISRKAAQYDHHYYGKKTGCDQLLDANDYVVASSEFPCGTSIVFVNKRTDKMLKVKVGDTRPEENMPVEFIVTKSIADKLNVVSQDEVGAIRLPDNPEEQKRYLEQITKDIKLAEANY